MMRKYLAFDIETAKDIPGEDFNWKPHRPIGICCAAALAEGAKQPIGPRRDYRSRRQGRLSMICPNSSPMDTPCSPGMGWDSISMFCLKRPMRQSSAASWPRNMWT